MKSLIVYYSLDGHTRLIADIIAKETGADIFELETVKPSAGKSGFAKFFLGGMRANFGQKPALKKPSPDLHDYDLIFIGTPIWASKNVPAINTFIAERDLAGKNVMLFSSSGGGDAGKGFAKLKNRLSGSKITGEIAFKEPAAADRDALTSKIKSWLSSAGVKE